mmetsp:Transcript_39639/g.157625  ORF Transcript_39639/g.157625 Transcript_39639/m.157625 type:complete len:366 (+) Transcript_39639:326-1423(+)
MDRMGYDYEGCHGEGRIMVFVGDLIDRGPDSISVVRLVRRLVEAKRAYCILGNHELNVLLGKANSGSKWLYGEKESLIRDKKDRHTLQALADEATRCEILDFLQNLPIVLERSDVRVVHAAWDDAAVDKLRSSKLRTVLDAYYFYKSEVDNMITSLLKTSTARAERDRLLAKWTPTGAEGLGPNQRYGPVSEDELYIQCGELMHQNENPVNVVLSGFEEVSPSPFFAGGKERTLRRKRWWNHYPSDSPLVVFGHYWRKASHTESNSEDVHLFGLDESGKVSCQPFSLLYTSERYVNAACVDYSIGRRYIERAEGKISGETGTALGALRLPEKVLYLHDRPPCDLRGVPGQGVTIDNGGHVLEPTS